MANIIPLGQPILIDHYSAKRDIKYRKKINETFQRSINESKKSDYYAKKALGVGSGGISSDDPDAIKKLREKLYAMQENHKLMKIANKIIRANNTQEKKLAGLIEAGFPEEEAKGILTPPPAWRKNFAPGFEGFELSNNNANIKRVKKRIEDLEKKRERKNVDVKTENYTYREDVLENRVMFIFDGKPSSKIREILKSKAFRWSPSRSAWVRKLTNAGIWAGKGVISEMRKLK